MLTFSVFEDGRPAANWPLQEAHLLGPDDIGVAGEVAFEDGLIRCEKRSADAAALALMMDVGECGRLILQTCLLPTRETPYILLLELARHRLKMLLVKLEDWALFDLDSEQPIMKAWRDAREFFTGALITEKRDPVEAESFAKQALVAAINVSERLAIMHADILLAKRYRNGDMPSEPLGCTVHQSQFAEPLARIIEKEFDFLSIPMRWRELEPEEGQYDWTRFDRWMEWASAHDFKVIAGPLVDFRPGSVPEWLYVWEHDYDTTHELLHEHIEAIIERYHKTVSVWNVASSLHVNDNFTLAYDQLMDLTRMASSLVKALHPAGKTMIEVTQPFGEYFFSNPRSIPPLVYAETVAQSGFRLDYMGVNVQFGHQAAGRGTRDLMQLSALLDKLKWLDLPIIISGLGVPSHRTSKGDSTEPDAAGWWRAPWSPEHQGEWLQKAVSISLSKPFVESVCIQELFDHQTSELPGAGLINGAGRAKPALTRISEVNREIRRRTLRCSRPEERTWSINELAEHRHED